MRVVEGKREWAYVSLKTAVMTTLRKSLLLRSSVYFPGRDGNYIAAKLCTFLSFVIEKKSPVRFHCDMISMTSLGMWEIH